MAAENDSERERELEDKELSSRESLPNGERSQQEDAQMPAPQDEEKATPPPKDDAPGPAPDGGLVAWLQVLGGFMLFFNTWGILKSV